ncbi:MAG: redoxin domain-containing protein [Acidobacteriia bacterium]|nr:redoxin domain-containing protein [Terriglobia bacterium]
MSIVVRASALLVPFLLLVSDSRTAAIGKPAPPLTLKQMSLPGDVPTWQDLHGTPVVLEFWATWCAPSVNSIPHLNELASKFRSVRFISVTDERPDLVEKFLIQHPIEGIVAFDDDGSTHSAYGVSGYPHTALVDGNGILRGIVSPSQLTEVILQQLAAGRAIDLQRPAGTECVGVFGNPLSEAKSGGTSSIEAGPGRWRGRDLPLKTILAAAYSIPETNILVPEAVAAQRYNIWARVTPPGGDALQVIRHRLELKVKMHREIRKAGEDSTEVLVVDSVATR